MIKVEIYDTLIPLIDEMAKRGLGLMSESLQVAGSQIAKEARASMYRQRHNWFNAFIDGKYKVWKELSGAKQLGLMMSHKNQGQHQPGSIGNMLSFYLSPSGLSVTVGGAHPRFQPRAYKDGIHIGNYGKPIAAVGKRGRAIIHKLNTGELNSDHPYSKKSWERFEGAKYKGRHFMDVGFREARKQIDKSIGARFEKSFKVAVNRVEVKGIHRKIA